MGCIGQGAFIFDPAPMSEPDGAPADAAAYDRVLIMFSGGKDSIALIKAALDAGVPRSRIELWHHDVDGQGDAFFDWDCTPGYCRAVAEALRLPIYFSHKVGGILGEMMRTDALTQPIEFQVPGGGWRRTGGTRGEATTRRNWPAKVASLTTRWCSAYAKIDVAAAAINNQPRFEQGRTLVLTGERGEESAARAKYKAFEPHRSDPRSDPKWVGHQDGRRPKRWVDHWRPVLRWTEQQVWDAMRALGIVPHPAYRLGWGRVSCLTCIFGSPHQWATIRAVMPDRFALIREREQMLGKTISHEGRRGPVTVDEIADRGRPYAAALAQPELVAVARSVEWLGGPVLTNDWQLPAGAFGEKAGPI